LSTITVRHRATTSTSRISNACRSLQAPQQLQNLF
jgi:hypothetical protein